MAWKKDLQKLKQSLVAEDPLPGKPAPPPKPKPTEFKPFEEEDAVFLSAMGHRPQAKAPVPAPPKDLPAPPPAGAPAPPVVTPPPPPAPAATEFASAMGDLKGLVAFQPPAVRRPPKLPAPVPVPPPAPAPLPPPAPEPVAAAPVPEPAPEPQTLQPVQINLAAGMAIEVDGALDLKGHGRNDAEERLKERILDGHALGWRSLHVILGTSEELRQMLQEVLKGPSGARVARFAQAPIPMGGSQAWILYFRNPGVVQDAN